MLEFSVAVTFYSLISSELSNFQQEISGIYWNLSKNILKV